MQCPLLHKRHSAKHPPGLWLWWLNSQDHCKPCGASPDLQSRLLHVPTSHQRHHHWSGGFFLGWLAVSKLQIYIYMFCLTEKSGHLSFVQALTLLHSSNHTPPVCQSPTSWHRGRYPWQVAWHISWLLISAPNLMLTPQGCLIVSSMPLRQFHKCCPALLPFLIAL